MNNKLLHNYCLLLVPGLLLALVLSCRGAQNLPAPSKGNSMEWEVGQSAESVTQVVQIGRRGELTIELSTNSLCTNSGVKVTAETEGKTLFTETVTRFPYSRKTAAPKNARVAITTAIVPVNENKCIWLGTVQCRASW